MKVRIRIRSIALAVAPLGAAVLLVPSAGARSAAPTAYPPVYRLLAHMTTAGVTPAPHGATNASGTFTATLAQHGTQGTLRWSLVFRGLTGPARSAHLHIGKTGPVAFTLCSRTCRSRAHGSYTGPIGTGSALLNALLHNRAYVDVHTARNPHGEIRARIMVAVTAAAGAGA
jgi:CHRD domain